MSDQHDVRWIRYGTRRRAVWFSIPELITESSVVFGRLSSVGAVCLTSASQTALKRTVEQHTDYREALVASRPGWLENFYIFGDGAIVSPSADAREIIVTFEPNQKFTPRGTLAEWQTTMRPFVVGQPLSYFMLALALAGPVMRIAPRGYVNPQVETVSRGEIGKSSLGVLAASIWAGNPDSDVGGGETWNLTLNSIDEVKRSHRDGFLFLDEGNLAAPAPQQRREFAGHAVFKIATTAGKRRMGDGAVGEHAHLAMLSTTNTALVDLIEGTPAARHAAQTRMITITIPDDAPHGVFSSVPAGFATALAATEAMRNAADQVWGTAARAFVESLVDEIDRDEARLRRRVAIALDKYRRLNPQDEGSARVQKTFALVAVTAALAREYGVFPKFWGLPIRDIPIVQHRPQPTDRSDADALELVRAYVNEHRSTLIDAAGLKRPLGKDEFEASSGILRKGSQGPEVLIPAGRFQSTFPAAAALMRTLRDGGHAQVETGQWPKLAIKTPRRICREGRVYCIRLGDDGSFLTRPAIRG